MKDMQIWALDSQNSLQAVRANASGELIANTSLSGVARTTNPTATSDGGSIAASFDDVGRQVMTVHQVRDLISTGSATLTRGTETTIITAVAATFLDVIFVSGSNTSGNALRVDLRQDVGGSVIDTLVIPATNTAKINYEVPYPAAATGGAITAKINSSGEISDSPVTITVLAARNV